MVFNIAMKSDKEIIDDLGGPAKVVALLGLSGRRGQIQRVHNWKTRGIPARMRLNHPDIFPAYRPQAADDM